MKGKSGKFCVNQLPASVTFTTSDELADRKENGEIPEDVHYIASQDHILIVPSHLYQTVSMH